jgi:MFS family permease
MSNFVHGNSSLVCATAPTSVALIVGRAIAGLGVGGLFSGAIVILAYCCELFFSSLDRQLVSDASQMDQNTQR